MTITNFLAALSIWCIKTLDGRLVLLSQPAQHILIA